MYLFCRCGNIKVVKTRYQSNEVEEMSSWHRMIGEAWRRYFAKLHVNIFEVKAFDTSNFCKLVMRLMIYLKIMKMLSL